MIQIILNILDINPIKAGLFFRPWKSEKENCGRRELLIFKNIYAMVIELSTTVVYFNIVLSNHDTYETCIEARGSSSYKIKFIFLL